MPSCKKTTTTFFAFQGPYGLPGEVGAKGSRGPPGRKLRNGKKDGFLFTRHSQTIEVPVCPFGSKLLYSGYSLLFINGNNVGHGQDLGMKHRQNIHTTTLKRIHIMQMDTFTHTTNLSTEIQIFTIWLLVCL